MKDFKYLKAGQPTKYEGSVTIDKCISYFEECVDTDTTEDFVDGPHGGKLIRRTAGKVQFPNAGGLARHLGVNKGTLYDWVKAHPEFAKVMDAMNAEQEDRLLNGGLSGTYNSTLAALIAGKHGYHRKIDSTISNPDGSMNPLKGLTTAELQALAEAEIVKKQE